MKIKFANKEYNFEMNGTVGPAFLVEKMTGHPFCPWGVKDEQGDYIKQPEQDDAVFLLYVILKLSNPEEEETMTLDWFLGHLTTPIVTELTKYVVARWMELEGFQNPKPTENEEGATEKKA